MAPQGAQTGLHSPSNCRHLPESCITSRTLSLIAPSNMLPHFKAKMYFVWYFAVNASFEVKCSLILYSTFDELKWEQYLGNRLIRNKLDKEHEKKMQSLFSRRLGCILLLKFWLKISPGAQMVSRGAITKSKYFAIFHFSRPMYVPNSPGIALLSDPLGTVPTEN